MYAVETSGNDVDNLVTVKNEDDVHHKLKYHCVKCNEMFALKVDLKVFEVLYVSVKLSLNNNWQTIFFLGIIFVLGSYDVSS